MKKKFTLEIASPCSENFDKMIPTSSGSFCNSCMKNVIDLSKKTNSEVAKFIAENKDQNICARLKVTQLEEEFENNEISKINNFKYAAAIAASVLLSSNIVGQEKIPVKTEINSPKLNDDIIGKVAFNQTVEKEVSIVIKGKLLEAGTNKPFSSEKYPDLKLSINGFESEIKVNPKTGAFSVPMQVLKEDKALVIIINGGDYYLSKTISFDFKSVKNNVLLQNIIIASDEFTKVYIAGGLGINYSEKR
ncbi:hypothetical protein GKZ90_0013265 [Flavobacterium sp. MC2016-06]|uniref:hypothetical protein n=1 Tax=Flavobacterium sp. MC2016-06 TaxID=2676308 RepID=UPI0012BA6610|nr:hypothetical protein [Flavobacterium sp. MC2016-06]MBU3859941.1 hypothetical protein [Flavobacterium sp. MC2016-06]